MNEQITDKEYCRPKTRGELRDKLKEGISCEVAGFVVPMTKIMLEGWLGFSDFTVQNSYNQGWKIFIPAKSIKEAQ